MTLMATPMPQQMPAGLGLTGTLTFTAMVVDDHPLIRESMVARLRTMGATDVVEAASVAEARARARGGARDLGVLDLALPDGSGLELIGQLRAEGWGRLVVLSAADDPHAVRAAFMAGAQGYLLKSASPTVVADGVRRVLDGGVYADPSVASLLAAGIRGGIPQNEGGTGELSGREIEVLELVVRRPVQQADRRGARPVRADREEPPRPHRPQARHRRPRRDGRAVDARRRHPLTGAPGTRPLPLSRCAVALPRPRLPAAVPCRS